MGDGMGPTPNDPHAVRLWGNPIEVTTPAGNGSLGLSGFLSGRRPVVFVRRILLIGGELIALDDGGFALAQLAVGSQISGHHLSLFQTLDPEATLS